MEGRIAIITARSGSKGLPDKNIKSLCGKPLLAYTIEAALKTDLFDCIHISTDSAQYAQIGVEYGAEAPFLRSEAMSSDTAGSWDVVLEVLDNYKKLDRKFESVCLLQPTSPLRRSDDIIGCYNLLGEKEADSVTSVCEVDHSPLWTTTLDDTLSLLQYRKNIMDKPRQKLNTYYRINGAVYIRRVEYSKDEITLLNNKEYAYIMKRKRSVDIDTLDDFKYAEFLIKQSIITF